MKKNTKKWLIPTLISTGIIATILYLSKDTSQEFDYDPNQDNATTPNGLNVTLLAQELHDAMKDMGTQTDKIYQTLSNIDEALFQKIAQRFGKRAYNRYLGNQININPFGSLPLYTLKEWLQFELSDDEYQNLKAKYPNSL